MAAVSDAPIVPLGDREERDERPEALVDHLALRPGRTWRTVAASVTTRTGIGQRRRTMSGRVSSMRSATLSGSRCPTPARRPRP